MTPKSFKQGFKTNLKLFEFEKGLKSETQRFQIRFTDGFKALLKLVLPLSFFLSPL